MCLTPIVIKNKRTEENTSVPCGKCPKCLARRISGWSFRLMQEEKRSSSSHFITLTYDKEKVPITRNNYMEIRKRDLQLFFKRLRKSMSSTGSFSGKRLKYYACGEYGGKTKRPHYHIILFNANVELVEKAWGKGHVHYGEVSLASVGYTLKYMCKPKKVPMHRNDDRQPEFSLMSKNWGLTTSLQKCADGIMQT